MSAALAAGNAFAQDYPAKPIRFIVGPGPDALARVIGQQITQAWGQPVIIDQRGGGGGTISAEAVAKSAPDGYTLLLATGTHTINPSMYKVSYDMVRDFAPVTLLASTPFILAVHPSVPANSVRELIALAKSKPGDILYASTGVGTAPHLSGELLSMRAGVKLVHVPYQGSPQAATDLIAGRVTMMFSPASAVVSQVEAGSLRVLASAASQRPGILPDVPTMAEAGMPDFDTSIWFGLMAPVGTPQEIVDKLARAVPEAIKTSEAQTALKSQGFDQLAGGPDVFARFIVTETAKWSEAAKAAGMKK